MKSRDRESWPLPTKPSRAAGTYPSGTSRPTVRRAREKKPLQTAGALEPSAGLEPATPSLTIESQLSTRVRSGLYIAVLTGPDRPGETRTDSAAAPRTPPGSRSRVSVASLRDEDRHRATGRARRRLHVVDWGHDHHGLLARLSQPASWRPRRTSCASPSRRRSRPGSGDSSRSRRSAPTAWQSGTCRSPRRTAPQPAAPFSTPYRLPAADSTSARHHGIHPAARGRQGWSDRRDHEEDAVAARLAQTTIRRLAAPAGSRRSSRRCWRSTIPRSRRRRSRVPASTTVGSRTA